MNQAETLPLARVGQDVTIWPLAKITTPEVIMLGDAVIIDDFVFLGPHRRVEIGSFVHIAAFALLAGGGELTMGDFSALSGGTRVYTGNEDYMGGCLTNPTVPAPYRLPVRSFVRLGKHVLIGANAVILPGVTIGEGAVVGANALVKADCEPWTVYVGTPARPIKDRPRTRIIALEAALRSDLYDGEGRYRPRKVRET